MCFYLLFVDDVDAGLDVGERVRGSKDGFPFKLFMQVTMSSSIECEWCAVDKAPQVVVLIKICDAVLHFISVKVRLNIRDLNKGLDQGKENPLLIIFVTKSNQKLKTGFPRFL